MSPTFDDEQQGRIINIGFAASALCPTSKSIPEKLGHAGSDILAVDAATLKTGAQKRQQPQLSSCRGIGARS